MKKIFYLLLVLGLCQISTGKSINSKEDGQVGVYHFNDNTGTVAVDSTLKNDGTITDGAWVTGKYGSAVYFNGTSAYIEMSVIPFDNAYLTFEAWIYLADSQVVAPFIAGRYEESGGWEVYVDIDQAPPYFLQTRGRTDGGSEVPAANTPENIPANKWIHFATTWDGLLFKMYINGEDVTILVEDGPGSMLNGDPVNKFTMGQRSIGGGSFLKGIIDEAAVYKRALSHGEIKNHYIEGKGKHIN